MGLLQSHVGYCGGDGEALNRGRGADNMTVRFRTLDNVDVAGKVVLVRVDLNVPMKDGRVTDDLRVMRLKPIIQP